MNPIAEYDSVWKEFIEEFFGPLIQFCFPALHERIDWTKPVQFREQELIDLIRGSELGNQRVDKLAQVVLKNEEVSILAHFEIQCQTDYGLPKRAYQYNFRIGSKHGVPVVSAVILGDDNRQWRPKAYAQECCGCMMTFGFLCCKLSDFHEADLVRSLNPVGLVLASHLAALRTASDGRRRADHKIRLIRKLFESGFDREMIARIFRYMDGFMALSPEMDVDFRKLVVHIAEEKCMPFLTSIERMAKAEGRQEGELAVALDNLMEVLEVRFGQTPPEVRSQLEQQNNPGVLKALHHHALKAASFLEFQKMLG